MNSSLMSFYKKTQQWNILLNSIPKLLQYFGDTEYNFYSLILFLECSPDIVHKIRIMSNRYNQSPFKTSNVHFI